MGEAREVMDRLTAAAFESKDFKAAAECYADGAVAVTPDQGEITGREAIAEYLRELADPFPDLRYEYEAKHESGNVAVDEWYTTGTNSAPLPMPTGETIPATGKQIRLRRRDRRRWPYHFTSHLFRPNGVSRTTWSASGYAFLTTGNYLQAPAEIGGGSRPSPVSHR
jgi:ketosteroid isomerase-like protein